MILAINGVFPLILLSSVRKPPTTKQCSSSCVARIFTVYDIPQHFTHFRVPSSPDFNNLDLDVHVAQENDETSGVPGQHVEEPSRQLLEPPHENE